MPSDSGWAFESFIHDIFRQGGSFTAQILLGQNNKNAQTTLEFTIRQSNGGEDLNDRTRYFRDFTDLERIIRIPNQRGGAPRVLGRYLQPLKAENENFDALLLNRVNELILFRITVGENHDIKSHELLDLHKHLPTKIDRICFVWMVPESNEGKYQRVKPVTSNATAEPKMAGRKIVGISDSGAYQDSVGGGFQFTQYRHVVKRKQLR